MLEFGIGTAPGAPPLLRRYRLVPPYFAGNGGPKPWQVSSKAGPECLHFIEADGTLRAGHEAFNEFAPARKA